MAAIDYVVRDGAGRLVRGTVGASGENSIIPVDTRSEVSLNLTRDSIVDYRRLGSTLEITLADGRILMLDGFFADEIVTDSRLYLSSEGQLTEITFSESWGRTNYAHFDEAATARAEGELLFEGASGVVTETETTMAAMPLFLGGGWGTAGAAGAAVVTTRYITRDGEDGGTPVDNKVDDTPIVANIERPEIEVDGTAPEGAKVYVTVADVVKETSPDAEGNWSVVFKDDDLPADGDYAATVRIVSPDGKEEEDLDGPAIKVDTTAPDVGVTSGFKSTGHIIDGEWQEGGVELSGTGEAGATIAVLVNGNEQKTIVDADGNWYVNVPEAVVPEGDYEFPVKITATDEAGNSTTLTDALDVDTVANELDLSGTSVGIDNVINDEENDAGVKVEGTATAGATIALTLAGAQLEAITDANGNWSATFPSGALPQGEYDATLVASTTDSAGNKTSDSVPVRVDTLGLVTVATASVENDGVINAAEAADGIVITGTTQPGSSVEVMFGTKPYTAAVGATGDWSVTVPAADITAGEYSVPVKATAKDAAGNVTVANGSVYVDTDVSVAFDDVQAGDNLITAQEANAGVILTGTTQAGADVTVTMNGVSKAATVSSDGTWSASYSSSDLPSGFRTLPLSVTAKDTAGNSATDTGTISLDTLGFVAISDDPVEGDGTINGVEVTDGVVFSGTTQPGSTVTVSFSGTQRSASVASDGTWTAPFPASAIPEGTYSETLTATAISPSGNEATDTATVKVDTEVNGFNLTSGTVGGDGLLGQADIDAGLTVTGTTEPGSTVNVSLGGASVSAFVTATGAWTATFAGGAIPSGEYPAMLEVTTEDAAGNQEKLSQSVVVDTVAGSLTISETALEGDDIINAAEAADGTTITGTADPSAVVKVTFAGLTKTVITGSDGNWQAYYSAAEIPEGTSTAGISAYTIDSAGNEAIVTDSVKIDTEVRSFAFSSAAVEGDDLITGVEAADGVVVSGTVEPGSSVKVKIADVEVDAAVSASGAWTAIFAADDISEGEYVATLLATATDGAGNVATINDTVQVDTTVTNLAIVSLPVANGEVLNAAASKAGITIGGTTEIGSTVLVTFEGTSQYATVATNGTWTTTFASSDIPVAEYVADVTVLATDAHGNTGTTTAEFQVDNQAPDAPLVTAFSTGITGLRGISTLMNDDSIEISELTDLGAVQDISYATTVDTGFGEVNYRFTTPVSDGSDLVVTAQDAADNSASTLFVLENEDDPSVNLSNVGLQNFDIEAVDLQFASDADVTLTAELVKSLSGNSDAVTIHGGADDQVTMQNAVKTSEVRQIGTQTYDVYTLGDDGVSVIIDRDIEVII